VHVAKKRKRIRIEIEIDPELEEELYETLGDAGFLQEAAEELEEESDY